ncbi:MAG: transport-associated protein [uncultured bacterium]|nr:MAG: transport-associated protein [uncultured bacterium]OGT16211.1 MAG: hypothetical protein A3B69_00940 [Gammaproteobacteria bacterium RIFCSPHIGHO2_02_FULL_38_33]OGT24177.1 MAG: hypothetical protein A2W47_01375 [Gammaproteobacteria bacterium RIFCSPHIGHO2_12_38_15]OGT69627.1 MAG: hypothetical protein A3I12_03275 [Gammaproteobacteria bacterium RIFCSPLOWO2_02_FULL_38_11]OGT75476.1 MAG: hypothetical protein A3G71_06525 [Gammaproteobacteria bacterium RIFCSPLOWO2_12_FULL_38_14]
MSRIFFLLIMMGLISLTACTYVKEYVKPPEDNLTPDPYMSNSVVTAKVKAAFISDPYLKNDAISVNVHRGRVQLSGFVDNKKESKRATQIAASVPGVLSVKNNLIVK